MPANSSQVRQLGGGRSTWVWRNADSYGREIIVLGEHVFDTLSLVTRGDFQNTIVEAATREAAGDSMQNCTAGTRIGKGSASV